MDDPARFPLVVLILSFLSIWLAVRIGYFLRKGQQNIEEAKRHDLDLIVTATLTLFGLIIGFSFSMVVNQYDQRKIYEETEANAIGTEYVRADLLPAADAARVQALLKNYLNQRILFYVTRDEHALLQIDVQTTQLQTELWSNLKAPVATQQTPVFPFRVCAMLSIHCPIIPALNTIHRDTRRPHDGTASPWGLGF